MNILELIAELEELYTLHGNVKVYMRASVPDWVASTVECTLDYEQDWEEMNVPVSSLELEVHFDEKRRKVVMR